MNSSLKITLFRKDSNVNGGKVFIATTDKIISYEIHDIDIDYEMTWTGLHF